METLGTILIVDDNPNNLKVLMALLVQAGYSVRPALSGEIALRAVQMEVPDLILLDVRMPDGLDGYQTCQQLRVNPWSKDIPVIFISAMDGTEDKVAGFRAGGVDYVAKPFQSEEVLARVKTHVQLSRIQRELEQRVAERTKELHLLNTELENRVLERTATLTSTLEKLRKTQDDLIQSGKLASLGFMVAGIAHELNTPLGTALMATSSLAAAQKSFDDLCEQGLSRAALKAHAEQARQLIELAERNLQRTASLINTFKEMAVDRTSEQRRCFNLHELVNVVLRNSSAILTTSYFNVQCSIPSDIGMESFPGAVEQVLEQFMKNAVNHAFEGRSFGQMQFNASLFGDGWVRIIFADDGCGIEEKNLSRVFDPFFTTKLGRGGSGLGLSIVHNIVTGMLGGRVSVTSTLGLGTQFCVEIPLSVR